MRLLYGIIAAVVQLLCGTAVSQRAEPGAIGEYCQLESFSPRCHHGDVIVMTTARFGRMRVGRCIDAGAFSDSILRQDDKTLGCFVDVLNYTHRECSGRERCDIAVPNRQLLATRPCLAQLTMYFEAAYRCVPVVDEDRSCVVKLTSGLRQHIRASSPQNVEEHRHQRLGDVSCGSASRPWTVEAETGQQINVSILDFGSSAQRHANNRMTSTTVAGDCRRSASSSDDVEQYGYIVDKTSRSSKKNVSICSATSSTDDRHRHVYLSSGNVVDIVLSSPSRSTPHNCSSSFLLAVEAVGCSNVVPASDSWLRRVGNEAVIGCYTTRQTWTLRCVDSQWTGTVGLCSNSDIGPSGAISAAVRNEDEAVDESQPTKFMEVVAIIAVSTVGLAVCLVIIFIGIGCARRYLQPLKTKVDEKLLCKEATLRQI